MPSESTLALNSKGKSEGEDTKRLVDLQRQLEFVESKLKSSKDIKEGDLVLMEKIQKKIIDISESILSNEDSRLLQGRSDSELFLLKDKVKFLEERLVQIESHRAPLRYVTSTSSREVESEQRIKGERGTPKSSVKLAEDFHSFNSPNQIILTEQSDASPAESKDVKIRGADKIPLLIFPQRVSDSYEVEGEKETPRLGGGSPFGQMSRDQHASFEKKSRNFNFPKKDYRDNRTKKEHGNDKRDGRLEQSISFDNRKISQEMKGDVERIDLRSNRKEYEVEEVKPRPRKDSGFFVKTNKEIFKKKFLGIPQPDIADSPEKKGMKLRKLNNRQMKSHNKEIYSRSKPQKFMHRSTKIEGNLKERVLVKEHLNYSAISPQKVFMKKDRQAKEEILNLARSQDFGTFNRAQQKGINPRSSYQHAQPDKPLMSSKINMLNSFDVDSKPIERNQAQYQAGNRPDQEDKAPSRSSRGSFVEVQTLASSQFGGNLNESMMSMASRDINSLRVTNYFWNPRYMRTGISSFPYDASVNNRVLD